MHHVRKPHVACGLDLPTGEVGAFVAIRSRLTVNTAEAAIDAAIAGLYTQVLSYQVEAALQAGTLELILDDLETEPSPVSLVYSGQGLLPLKTPPSSTLQRNVSGANLRYLECGYSETSRQIWWQKRLWRGLRGSIAHLTSAIRRRPARAVATAIAMTPEATRKVMRIAVATASGLAAAMSDAPRQKQTLLPLRRLP